MMARRSITRPIGFTILLIAGTIVIGYFLLYIFAVPDLKIEFDHETGMITNVLQGAPHTNNPLFIGDQIISIGGVMLSDLALPGAASIASLAQRESLALRVRRGSREYHINWPITPPTPRTYILRMLSLLPGLIFMAAAAFVFFFVRPQNLTSLLLLASFALIAVWLTGRSVSDTHLYWSDAVFRAAVWLVVPTALHFAWRYPRPLDSLPGFVIPLVYGIFSVLAVSDIFLRLPHRAYIAGIAFLTFGLSIIISTRLRRLPPAHRDLRLMFIALSLLFGLSAVLAVLWQMYHTQAFYFLSLAALSGIPFALFYPLLRREMIGLEMRANQAMVLLVFTIITIVVFIFFSLLVPHVITDTQAIIPVQMMMGLMYTVTAVSLYPSFSQLVQRRLLGIRIPSRELMNRFTGHIVTSLETRRLAHVLCEELAPSLLIRQMMFIQIDENGLPRPIASCGEPLAVVHTPEQIASLVKMAGRYRSYTDGFSDSPEFNQVRLVLTMVIDGQLVGLVLFGRRDPDDYYSAHDITILQTFMDQASLALMNIAQAERLHHVYQANIQRSETERQSLARALHDDVLGPLAIMMMNASWKKDPIQFQEAYQSAAARIRSIIDVLRPSILDHSLPLAIDELTGRMANLAHNGTRLLNQVQAGDVRYDPSVEMQVYRILQEACHNAILHGKASQVVIGGNLSSDGIYLTVTDNGVGFETHGPLDLTELLRERHYGLVGIFERAALIGGEVQIQSALNKGTTLSFRWGPKNAFPKNTAPLH